MRSVMAEMVREPDAHSPKRWAVAHHLLQPVDVIL